MTIPRSCFRHAIALLLLSAAVSVSTAGPPPEAQAKAYLEELWRSTETPGISVAVMAQGRLAFSEGVGFADLENLVPATGSTVYSIGSVSKALTAVAVLQLVEQGKVRLEEPIQKYVPSFPDKGSPITIRHIMTHTSGIRHYRSTDFPDSEDNENMRPIASLEEGKTILFSSSRASTTSTPRTPSTCCRESSRRRAEWASRTT
jgi:CubicO group peptidase (beta-lactamase class C family)